MAALKGRKTNMTACESFEIAMEMQRRGVLDPGGSEALRAHLAACSSCRNYAALIGRTEHVMSLQVGGLDLNALDMRISKFVERESRGAWFTAALGVLLMAILAFIAGILSAEGPGRFLLIGAPAAVVLVAALWGRSVWVRRQFAQPRRTETSVLDSYRKMLELQAQKLKAPLVMVVVFFVRPAFELPELFRSQPLAATLILVAWLSLVGGVAWWRHKRMRDIRRELASLER